MDHLQYGSYHHLEDWRVMLAAFRDEVITHYGQLQCKRVSECSLLLIVDGTLTF